MLRIACLAISTTVLFMVLGGPSPAVSQESGRGAESAGETRGTCHEVTCPCCHHVCKLSSEIVKEKNYCWNVECKPICIPRVRFPWEKNCKPKCAKIKYVNVLEKREYECENCTYKWTPVCADCGCDGSWNGWRGRGDCCDRANGGGSAYDWPAQSTAPLKKVDKQARLLPLREGEAGPTSSVKTDNPPVRFRAVVKRTLSDG